MLETTKISFPVDADIVVEKMKSAGYKNEKFGLANLRNEKIVITGGHKTKDRGEFLFSWGNLSAVLIYDPMQNEWNSGPYLQVARYAHACCSIKDNVYVFCGNDKNDTKLSSIEAWDSKAAKKAWQLLQPEGLIARSFTCACPVNDREILIYGGMGKKEDQKETVYPKDVLSFDTVNGTLRTLVEDVGYSVTSYGQAYMAEKGFMFSLMLAPGNKVNLLRFEEGNRQLRRVEDLGPRNKGSQ